MLRHYDLFAGIGGFSVAVDEVFRDVPVRHIFAELDPFCTAVLRRHWPDGIFYGDVRSVAHQHQGGQEADTHTILTGGFPCQPFSHAGVRAGTDDDRYLWPAMLEVIRVVRPAWVIAENVLGLVTWQQGMALERVCADLEREGYAVQPVVVPAVGVGAPHRRDRAWIIAAGPDSDGFGRQAGGDDVLRHQHPVDVREEADRPDWSRPWQAVAHATCDERLADGLPRIVDGVPYDYDRWRNASLSAYGNSIVPQVAVEILKAVRIAWEGG